MSRLFPSVEDCPTVSRIALLPKTKRETIPRLVKLGLTAEQVSEALDLPIQEVNKIIASQE